MREEVRRVPASIGQIQGALERSMTPGAAPPGEWPLGDLLELTALPSAVPCARLHARHLLREWDMADLTDSIELITSELVTNALQASGTAAQAAPISLWLLSDQAQVVVLVWDASAMRPVPMRAGAESEKGRGLVLVEAVSARWAGTSRRTSAAKPYGRKAS
jgi:anti-sigma regulatory factor (Ser/Thr protein kinase)